MPVYLMASLGYEAGLTDIVRKVDRPESNMNKKGVIEAVTIVETPLLGVVGYVEAP